MSRRKASRDRSAQPQQKPAAPEAKGLAARFRAARERRGLSLAQIGTSTKIPVKTLEALEKDDISLLPAGVLGRGFIRQFAVAVGLDPDATVAEFQGQFPTHADGQVSPAALSAALDMSRPSGRGESRSWRSWLRFAGIGVMVVALAVYFGMDGS